MKTEAFDDKYWETVDNRDPITAQYHTHGVVLTPSVIGQSIPIESVAETMPVHGPDPHPEQTLTNIRYALGRQIAAVLADPDTDPAEQARHNAMRLHPSMATAVPQEELDNLPGQPQIDYTADTGF